MAKHNDIGENGEELATNFLLSNGYSVLEKNYRFDRAEIDIIAKNDKLLIFVEVKTRTTDFYGNPEDFLSIAQQKRITKAAQHFIEENNWQKEIRFDIIAINHHNELHHIKDAFFIID
ncbi:MAG: YraN family protein [Chitinophagales bacterium]